MTARPILQTDIPAAPLDALAAVTRVAEVTGQTPASIVLDMSRAVFGPRRLSLREYFELGGWIGTPEDRQAVIGKKISQRLPEGLIATGPMNQTALMDDKYLSSLVLTANGLSVPTLKAAFGAFTALGKDTLTTPEALARWLSDPGNLPAFGKPNIGARALGSIPLRTAEGGIDIGDRAVTAPALAEAVAKAFPRGWLIQEQLRQPPEIEAMIGPGVGSIRVTSLWEEGGPQLMYAAWRHPPVGAWVDATILDRPNVFCAVDASGRILRAQQGLMHNGKTLTHSLVTPSMPLLGFTLPWWPRIVDICLTGHRLFPGHALIGWDVVLTERGPVITEMNARPLHMLLYQRAFARGYLHAEHRQRLDLARRLLAERTGQAQRKTGKR
ncbi:MAG: hypothetical protein HC783_10285 [Rhodobacteraceae bacterium]|nr:hypothetical protein [Paracoccaceae bacterium]